MVQSGVVQSGDGSLSGLVPVQEAVVQDQVFTLMHEVWNPVIPLECAGVVPNVVPCQKGEEDHVR